ncbi:MAG TPA: LLM class flavin-dependent oxidoreductase [Acidimicrobiales bacterium]|nr:LLM class flavin-dependent oxidoreductase [Acidimicrobiales bacterium]
MVNVGVVVPSPLPAGMALPDIPGLAREAETAGLDCIWAEDHLAHGDAAVLDLACVLAAAAAATETIEVGSAVFVPSLRNLTWALRQVATLQLVARGRLQLGVALGAAGEQEYGLAGFTREGQRERTDEFLSVLAAARKGESEGEGVGAPVSRQALLLGTSLPVPPVWVGGTSPAALRRAARFGDGWLSGFQTPDEFRASLGHLRQLAEERNRPCPPAGLVLHIAAGSAPSTELVAQSASAMQELYGVPTQRAEELAIGGTPGQVADELARYVDAGAVRFCLVSNVLPWSESWPLLGQVRRLLRGT